MTGIKHKKIVTKPQNPYYEVSRDEWNDEHNIDDASIPVSKLSDILITNPSDNEALTYELASALWKNKANALLLDGSRAMTGNFTMTQGSLNAYLKKEVWYANLDRLTLDLSELTNPSNSIAIGDVRIYVYNSNVIWASRVNPDSYVGFTCGRLAVTSGNPYILFSNGFIFHDDVAGWYIDFKSWDGVARQLVAELTMGRLDLFRAGDITLLDDKFLKIGKDSDGTLPTPDASYRGKMIRVEGGAGVADKLYMCMKSAADTYSWVLVVQG